MNLTPAPHRQPPAARAPRRTVGRSEGPTIAFESLRKRADFGRVLREGRRARQPDVAFAARPNGLGSTRVGFAVGRRVGGAVTRNRVRRRLRALVRTAVPAAVHKLSDARAEVASPASSAGNTPGQATGGGWDIVITALTDSTRVPFETLADQLRTGLDGALAGGSTRRPPSRSRDARGRGK